jgi:hypothetical protein
VPKKCAEKRIGSSKLLWQVSPRLDNAAYATLAAKHFPGWTRLPPRGSQVSDDCRNRCRCRKRCHTNLSVSRWFGSNESWWGLPISAPAPILNPMPTGSNLGVTALCSPAPIRRAILIWDDRLANVASPSFNDIGSIE